MFCNQEWAKVLSVLAVDDNKRYLNLLAIVFEISGINIKLAESAEEALDALRGQSFDLVLTDLKMQKMDGMELAMKIRQTKPDLPIIMLTSCMTSHISELAAKAGISRILDKTIPPNEIAKIIMDEFDKRVPDQNGTGFIADWVCPECGISYGLIPLKVCTNCGYAG